jgi:hypothetical protein
MDTNDGTCRISGAFLSEDARASTGSDEKLPVSSFGEAFGEVSVDRLNVFLRRSMVSDKTTH